MVKYTTIVKVMDSYLKKCTNYPKYQALKYFKEHPENFKEEQWYPDQSHNGLASSPTGKLFHKQRILQNNVKYTETEQYLIRHYGIEYFKVLQVFSNGDNEHAFSDAVLPLEILKYMRLVEGGDENNMNDWEMKTFSYPNVNWVSLQTAKDIIDDTIDKSPPLQQDTVLYAYARLPTDSKGNPVSEGRSGTYKGLRGVSYNKNLVHNPEAFLQADSWANPDTRYNITYYCLKGTKGLNLDENLTCDTWQNERLFHSGQRATVYKVNEKTKEAIVIIY